MFTFNPLEQFTVEICRFWFYFSNITVLPFPVYSLNTLTLMFFINFNIVCFLILFVCCYSYIFKKESMVMTLILVYFFIADLLHISLGVKKNSFILIMLVTFLFISVSNLLGMISYTLTVTSHLLVTLYFSLSFFIAHSIIGLCYHKQRLFAMFIPKGVPEVIVPFLILIEYVSYLSRILSLSIRLFANMVSGHILMKILVGFAWKLIGCNKVISSQFILVFPMCLVIFSVIFLEITIAILQAYVFTALLAIYLNGVMHTH